MRIDAGQRWVLLGPNGGGKTTLLAVAGARRAPSGGSARVFGASLGRADIRAMHPDIGHASHSLAELLPPRLGVIDIVLTGKQAILSPWLQTYEDDDRTRARQRLVAVGCGGLSDRIYVTCSQGERQRVLLARAMFGEPRLLVLDEPCAGLDLPAREALITAVDRSAVERPDLAVIIATHHLEEVPRTATHAALLRDGPLVASGPIERVLTDPHLAACFDMEIEVERLDGRWRGVGRPTGPDSP